MFRVPENVVNDVHSNAMKVWTSGHILFSSSRLREVKCVDLSSREIWLGGQVMKCKIEELLKSKPRCSLVIPVTPLRCPVFEGDMACRFPNNPCVIP